MGGADAAREFCLAGFFEVLRTHRFQIGPDRCLRILRLLAHIEYRCDPERLGTLLGPLIATSAEEQERFRILFRAYYPFLPSPRVVAPETPVEVTGERRRRSSTGIVPPQLPDTESVPRRWSWRHASLGVAAAGVIATAAIAGDIPYTRPPSPPPPPCDSTPGGCASQTGDTLVPPVQPDTAVVTLSLAFTPPTTTWYQRHQKWIRAGALGLPIVLLLASELLRRRRRPPPVPADAAGPFYQPLEPPGPGRWYRSLAFYTAARMLRQRQLGETLRLAVEQTVSATIERMGYPTWKYRRDTRPPEYLALVDRSGPRDHQARHLDSLVEGLKREGVILERYFFDGDPRLCHPESMKEVVPLANLERRFHGSRLLLLGDGYRLLDPVQGTLLPWTMLFESWRERAILTPTPPVAWSASESALAERFLLAPATTEGLQELVLALAPDSGADRRDWQDEAADEIAPPPRPERALHQLRRSLGQPVFRWLCACAIYPELRWDLTVYLGALPEVGANLVTEGNLLVLARLPWFRQGVIPEPVRAELIRELPPETEAAVRKALLALLQRALPPEGSLARRRFDAEIAVQQLGLARQEPGGSTSIPDDLLRVPRDHFLAELETSGLTDTLPRSPVARLVPARWWPALFEHGLPAFPMRARVRLALALVAFIVAWLALPHRLIPPGKLEITPDSAVLQLGTTTARIASASAGATKYRYVSSDRSVVSVDSLGTVVPLAAGRAAIEAQGGGLSAAAQIEVLPINVPPKEVAAPLPSDLRIVRIVPGEDGETRTDRLLEGGAIQLMPVLSDSFLAAPEARVSWASRMPTVARVSQSGVVTAVGPGRATIVVSGAQDTVRVPITVLARSGSSTYGVSELMGEPALVTGTTISLGPGALEMLRRKAETLRALPGLGVGISARVEAGQVRSPPIWARKVVDYLREQGVDVGQLRAADVVARGAWTGVAFSIVKADTGTGRTATLPLEITFGGASVDRAGRPLLTVGDSVAFRVASRMLLRWSSSSPSVLDIDPRKGDAVAVAPGEATVRAESGRYLGTVDVRVSERTALTDGRVTGLTLGSAERLLAQLRSLNGVSPLPLKPGETTEIHKAPGNAVYGFTSATKLAGEKIGGPIMVQSQRSAEYDLEVHRLGGTIELVGFVSAEQAKLILAGQPVKGEIALGVQPSGARSCVIPVQLDRLGGMFYESGLTRQLNTRPNPTLILTGIGRRVLDGGQKLSMLCVEMAAGK